MSVYTATSPHGALLEVEQACALAGLPPRPEELVVLPIAVEGHSAGWRPQPNGAPPLAPLGPAAPDPEWGVM